MCWIYYFLGLLVLAKAANMNEKIKSIMKHLIGWVEIYVSISDLDWAERFRLLLYGPATMLLFVIAIIAWVITTSSGIFLALLYLIWLLIFFLYTFYEAYSMGIDEGIKVAENPQPKTIEIQNTWLSHIYHACKTLILLWFVICFLPWFIVYRLGKWKNSHVRKKETNERRKFRDSRAQHYVFVHQILRDLFFDIPDKIIAILKGEAKNDSLLDLWNKVGKEVGESRLVAPDGLCCESRMLDNNTAVVLITLPPPQLMNEAYFVALVYRPSSKKEETVARFITLEHSVDLGDGSLSNVLCEWGGSVHNNMGYGCESTLEDFFEEVCSIL